ncbi:energy-coupling factor ABC transporter permease [Mycoplasma sp. P36-A1]|uniref:energy-coupling factor ABC transporter permease n=1 Tax=Mycoplasma sp. P36-A1 TaxID=3252900 RepID=UPI003C2ADAAB
MKLEKKERRIVLKMFIFMCAFAFTNNVSAMHIMEGFLPPGWSICWSIVVIPFLVWGYFNMKKEHDNNKNTLLLFATCAAYVFLVSALKLPSVTGSSSHATGIALGAILLGPSPMAIIGFIVLLFQALILNHGGLTTLGANIFSMAIVGAFSAYAVYILLKKLKVKPAVCIFVATLVSNLATYSTTALQLGLAFPDPSGGVIASLIKFLSVFAITQIPLALVESILTVMIFEGIKNKDVFSKDTKELIHE